MDRLKMFEGNACFLVKNTSETMSRNDFEGYLSNEGFQKFTKYSWCNRGSYYINVNSLRYSAGVCKAAPLTGTIVGESLKDPLTIEEFQTIWDILKAHIPEFTSTNEIRKGSSSILVCDEVLDDFRNDFIDFLECEGFREISNDSYGGRGFAAVNVKSMMYSRGDMADILVSGHLGSSSNCCLSVDEFQTVWMILKRHHRDKSYLERMNSQANDRRACEIDKRLAECGKFRNYSDIDEYIDDVKFCLIHYSHFTQEAAENFARDKKDEIMDNFNRKTPADVLAFDYYIICG